MTDFELKWINDLKFLKSRSDICYDAATELFYGSEISNYIYDSEEATQEFIELFYKEIRDSKLISKTCSGFVIIDLFIIFKSLNYDVTSLYRDTLIELDEASDLTYLDISIHSKTGFISFIIKDTGYFYVKSISVGSTVGNKISFNSFEDLLTKIQTIFNLLMSTNHNLLKIYRHMQEDGVLYEQDYEESKEIRKAYDLQIDYEERQNNLTKAIINAANFIEGKKLPYPDI